MCACVGGIRVGLKKKKVLLELNFEDEWELTQWMRKKKKSIPGRGKNTCQAWSYMETPP